jgi:autotransporter-associated beta strand protein
VSSLNVILDDSEPHPNIWEVLATVLATELGIYNADGRLDVDPNDELAQDFIDGSNGLAALNGTPPASDRVSLLIADCSQGGVATLASWGMSITGVSASSGTLTPGANASISDAGAASNNMVAVQLDTTGADADALVLNVAGTMTFSDSVIGSAGITKNNSGMLKLNGINTYMGPTTVNAGFLSINGSTSTSSAVTVSNDGSKLMGTGTVGGATTINSGAILAPGNSVGKETFANTLTLNPGSIFEWELAATPKDSSTGIRGTDYDAVNVTAAIPLAGSGAIFRVVLDGTQNFGDAFWNANHTWTDIFKTADSGSDVSFASIFSRVEYWNTKNGALTDVPATQGAFTYSGNTLTWNYTAVPESSSALAGLLLGACLMRRRRK